MPKSKSLTTSTATSQAAGRVRQLMPGELVTANTARSHDLVTDTPLLVTTVTYPAGHPAAVDARAALMRMPAVRKVEIVGATGYMTIVREA